MTDPKGKKPDSDNPHEDDLPLELPPDQEGEEHPLDIPVLNASTDDFNFSGPAEELDFTEPADFTFPTDQALGGESAAEHASVEGLFGSEESALAESPLPEEAAVEPELAGEGIADLEAAEEEKDEKPKPKFELPAWARTAEWIAVGVLAVGSLLAVIISVILVDKNPKQVTLTLNIACPVMLGLIPYALWRGSSRWVTPASSAIYTVMLALSAAALISGTWFEGLELSRYDWQFSKARVTAGKPRLIVISAPAPPVDVKEAEPAAGKSSAEPAAKEAEPAAKGTATPAAKNNPEPAVKDTAEPAAK